MYFKGFTKSGFPVIYMRPGRDTNDDNDLKFKYLVYTLERAVAHLPPGIDFLCWLIDFKGFSTKLTGMSNLQMSRRTLHVLQHHYPERLGQAVLLNAPTMFSIFFKIVSPFIDEKTKHKVAFAFVARWGCVSKIRDRFIS